VIIKHSRVWVATSTAYAARKLLTHASLAYLSLSPRGSLGAHSGLLQAGHQAASTAVDSDSDDGEDFDQYSDLDAFDTDEVEVSPDDEQALAAFMVSLSATLSPQRYLTRGSDMSRQSCVAVL